MKVIIDFIEDVREHIGNRENFIITAMLLKEDKEDASKLVYSGETPLRSFYLDDKRQELKFKIDASEDRLSIGQVIPSLLILGMDKMMYQLKINVNSVYNDVEVVGFGKNEEEEKYILFLKI